jgi:hypothetical protein
MNSPDTTGFRPAQCWEESIAIALLFQSRTRSARESTGRRRRWAVTRRSGPFPPEECPLRPPKAPRRHSRSTSAGRAIHAMPSLPSSGARRDATSAPVAVLPISQLYRNAPHTLQWGNAPQARIEPQLGKLEKDQASRSPGRAIYIVPHRGEHNRPEVSLKAPFSPRSA